MQLLRRCYQFCTCAVWLACRSNFFFFFFESYSIFNGYVSLFIIWLFSNIARMRIESWSGFGLSSTIRGKLISLMLRYWDFNMFPSSATLADSAESETKKTLHINLPLMIHERLKPVSIIEDIHLCRLLASFSTYFILSSLREMAFSRGV